MENIVLRDSLDEYTQKVSAKYKNMFAPKSAVGAPLSASTAAEMTDTTKIYVYTGSESGYTAGNWYYYDGSAWTSGGVYNSTAFQTDTTLSIAGAAADAKITGDALAISVHGIAAYLGAAAISDSSINADFDNLPNNVIRACGVYNSPHNSDEVDNIAANRIKISHAPVEGQMTGLIVTLGRKTERVGGDTQIFIPWHGGTVLCRQYNSVSVQQPQTFSWSDWVTGTEALENEIYGRIDGIPQYRMGINSSASSYNNLLSNYTEDGTFLAMRQNWNDVPSSAEDYVISNSQYSSYITQTAIGITSGEVYNRIVHKTNKTVYRTWKRVGDNRDEPQTKILAIGDSICYGGRNNNKGFVGDLGMPYVNKSIVGIRLSERNDSNNPAVRDVENGFYRPSIASLFDYMTGREIIPNRSVFPINMQFNGALITSLDAIPLPSGYYPDIIIADGGVNDYIQSAELGTLPSIPVYDDLGAVRLDRQTVLGSLQYLFYSMIQAFPKAQRFFVITHKTQSNGTYWATAPNSAGYNQQQLHDAVVACCRLYNVTVIDIYQDSFINSIYPQYRSSIPFSQDNSKTYTEYVDTDGIHPMALGYQDGYIPLVREAIKIGTVKS